MKISVCLATFNGSKFICAQIDSIIKQLRSCDELIIVDDGSNDNTVPLIKSYNSPLIRLYVNKINLGPALTFNQALNFARGDLIFLSDQDDIWEANKISYIRNLFLTTNSDLIVHNATIVNKGVFSNTTLFEQNCSQKGVLKNIYRNTYTGCCMAFKGKILERILPISSKIGLFHDAWIGVLSEYYGFKVLFVNVPLIKFMRHDNNASSLKRRPLYFILRDRIFFIYELIRHILTHKLN